MTILKNSKALYINGEWMSTDQLEAVLNPATEAVLGEAPVGTAAHVEAAISAAHEAFHKGPWPRLQQRERQAKMTEFLDAIERRAPEIIQLIVAEAGATQMLAQYLQYGIPMQHARHMVEISS